MIGGGSDNISNMSVVSVVIISASYDLMVVERQVCVLPLRRCKLHWPLLSTRLDRRQTTAAAADARLPHTTTF